MSISLIKRACKLSKTEGIWTVAKKIYIYILAKSVSRIAGGLYKVNSREYWNFRMKYDWNAVGGGVQTQLFSASLFANVDFKNLSHIDSVLDFGCATGESAPIFQIFMPMATIYLHDLSEEGVNKAVRKYSRFLKVDRWNGIKTVDLVYCSNVIEHIADPRMLVNELIASSNKYVIIQCPWDERHSDGTFLNPNNPVGEHVWTVNEDFYLKYMQDERISWDRVFGSVPMAWEGGKQVYFVGRINN